MILHIFPQFCCCIMQAVHDMEKAIFEVTPASFEPLCLEIFRYQYAHNLFYRTYCNAVRKTASSVDSISGIPFLPIQFFKTQRMITGNENAALTFESSGTTGSTTSRHYVQKAELYIKSFTKAFSLFYGDPEKLCIIGLLPSYLERAHSSLVYMVNELIKTSAHLSSGFYLYDHEKLHATLEKNEREQQPTLLIGVTYALLDFADKYSMDLQYTTVMETGGMKGRREELTRQEVHRQLRQRLGIHEVHSEYGMTELLSQAYSNGNGIFHCPPWMKIVLRAEDDPFEITTGATVSAAHKTGAVNVIDLANLYSCSFIATDDIGTLYPDERFEISGRLDNSDIRGCGLMML